MTKNYFEKVNTIQGVHETVIKNLKLIGNSEFLEQYYSAYEKNKTHQIGQYGKYEKEIGTSADEFIDGIKRLLALENIRIYENGKRLPDVKLSIRYSVRPYGVNVSGDTKLVREYLRGMKYRWNSSTCEWWHAFKVAPEVVELPKSLKLTKPVEVEKPKAEKKTKVIKLSEKKQEKVKKAEKPKLEKPVAITDPKEKARIFAENKEKIKARKESRDRNAKTTRRA